MKKRKICPNCKSSHIGLFIGYHTGNYQCQDCGYIGPIVIEEEKITKGKKHENKKTKKK